LGALEEEAVLKVLRSGWLTTGPQTQAFEEEFAAFLKVSHALAVNSCTSGLHLALVALGLGIGDKVAVPTWTFAATAEVVRYVGAEVVLIDIEPNSPQMDMDLLEAQLAADPQIRGVIVVHFAGAPVNFARLLELKSIYGFSLIEDCAHAFPVTVTHSQTGLPVSLGTLGDIGVFSFYANKTLTTGEGGMMVTSRPELAQTLKQLRLHGINRDAFDRFQSKSVAAWDYQIAQVGYKYNMPDLAGALGRVQLKRAPELLTRRREIAAEYYKALSSLDWCTLDPWTDEHSWHLFTLQLVPNARSWNRDQLIAELNQEGIGTSVHYRPLHLMEYYRKRYNLQPEDFPRSCQRFLQTLSLPFSSYLTDEQIQRVLSTLVNLGSRL